MAPSLFKKGLWEAQVPLNSPFFLNISLTDIKMKNIAINPIPSNTVAMRLQFDAKLKNICNLVCLQHA
ncbi:hypothetical protein MARINOS108_140042 [Marinoscillum sp. 108]|nr:hypothetical protein MARINOS108_140042 [Marinoscillum sp. 108]